MEGYPAVAAPNATARRKDAAKLVLLVRQAD